MDPDLILIIESWCSEDISDAFLSIPGYELQTNLRVDREDTAGGRGGGLLVYSKSVLKILSCDRVVPFNQHCMEVLTELIRSAGRNSIFIGDFNLPEIDWHTGHARGTARSFLEATEDMLLEQLVDFSTHLRGNTLDLLLTNIP